jgi:hypothetical protein
MDTDTHPNGSNVLINVACISIMLALLLLGYKRGSVAHLDDPLTPTDILVNNGYHTTPR